MPIREVSNDRIDRNLALRLPLIEDASELVVEDINTYIEETIRRIGNLLPEYEIQYCFDDEENAIHFQIAYSEHPGIFHRILEEFHRGYRENGWRRRTITSIASNLGLPEDEVRNALTTYTMLGKLVKLNDVYWTLIEWTNPEAEHQDEEPEEEPIENEEDELEDDDSLSEDDLLDLVIQEFHRGIADDSYTWRTPRGIAENLSDLEGIEITEEMVRDILINHPEWFTPSNTGNMFRLDLA